MARVKNHEKLAKPKPKSATNGDSKKVYLKKIPMFNSVLAAICIAVAAWFSYKGYLETRVNTPFDTEKVRHSPNVSQPWKYKQNLTSCSLLNFFLSHSL